MNELTIITQNNQLVTDSRDVARMVGKEHKHLLRDIKNYLEILGKTNFGLADFFIESYYNDSQGKPRPHFYLTKKGCDMVANKLTGEKGVIFTATYVSKFEEMEQKIIKHQPQSQAEMLLMFAQQMVDNEKKVKQLEQQVLNVNHRIDTIDKLDTIGDLQQRLNAMVRKYATSNGLPFSQGWRDFKSAFNTAYRTNITMLVENYKLKHGLKNLTIPQYLSLVNRLDDAVRVADKLLNKAS